MQSPTSMIFTILSTPYPTSRTNHPRYGRYYCRYKANAQTTYYLTFDVVQDFTL